MAVAAYYLFKIPVICIPLFTWSLELKRALSWMDLIRDPSKKFGISWKVIQRFTSIMNDPNSTLLQNHGCIGYIFGKKPVFPKVLTVIFLVLIQTIWQTWKTCCKTRTLMSNCGYAVQNHIKWCPSPEKFAEYQAKYEGCRPDEKHSKIDEAMEANRKLYEEETRSIAEENLRRKIS